MNDNLNALVGLQHGDGRIRSVTHGASNTERIGDSSAGVLLCAATTEATTIPINEQATAYCFV
jgi:hypothetical protein